MTTNITKAPAVPPSTVPQPENPTVSEIMSNTSNTFLQMMDELLTMPQDTNAVAYIGRVFTKENRLTYIAILGGFLFMYIKLVRSGQSHI